MSPLIDDKLSFNVPPELLGALNQLAASQGRQLQAVLEDALREYLERQQREQSRQHVVSKFTSSLNEFDDLYKDLAK
jgi:hypothetical protein